MNDYRQLTFNITPASETAADVLAAMLADEGFESFVPNDCGLDAFIKAGDYNRAATEQLVADFKLEGIKVDIAADTFIEGRDWNSEWEKNYFKPIVIGNGRCVIHSTFHTGYPCCEHEIVIDPKMAFGTGHHSTTELMATALLDNDVKGKKVIDMGTGTGILAILAMQCGAASVTAIEIDPAAVVNARENVVLNGCGDIKVEEGDASLLSGDDAADIFLANINRNIILGDMHRYVAAMRPGAMIVMSGFYGDDAPMIEARGMELGLEPCSRAILNDWCRVIMIKK